MKKAKNERMCVCVCLVMFLVEILAEYNQESGVSNNIIKHTPHTHIANIKSTNTLLSIWARIIKKTRIQRIWWRFARFVRFHFHHHQFFSLFVLLELLFLFFFFRWLIQLENATHTLYTLNIWMMTKETRQTRKNNSIDKKQQMK